VVKTLPLFQLPFCSGRVKLSAKIRLDFAGHRDFLRTTAGWTSLQAGLGFEVCGPAAKQGLARVGQLVFRFSNFQVPVLPGQRVGTRGDETPRTQTGVNSLEPSSIIL